MSYKPVSFHKGTTVALVPSHWTSGHVSCEGRRKKDGTEFTVFDIGGGLFSVYEKGIIVVGDDGGEKLPKSHVEPWDAAKAFGVSNVHIKLDELL